MNDNQPDGKSENDTAAIPDYVWQMFTDDESATREVEAVGELWQPHVPERPAWHELDDRGKRRRVSRIVAVVLACAVMGTLSWRPAEDNEGRRGSDRTTSHQSTEAAVPGDARSARPSPGPPGSFAACLKLSEDTAC